MTAARELSGPRAVPQEDLARDYDELVSMHEAVQVEAARYRALFDAAPSPLVVTDENLRILEANEAAAALLEVALRFLLGKPLAAYIERDARRDLRMWQHRLATIGGAHVANVRMRRRSGVSFDARVTVTAGRGELYWTIRDRTEEAQAEARLWELNQELEDRVSAQSAALAELVEQLPVGIAVLEPDGSLAWMNGRAAEIVGGSLEPRPSGRWRVDKSSPDGGPVPEDELPTARALRGETVRDVRLTIRRPDGSAVTAQVNAAPLTSGGGAVVVLDDMTQRERIERADAEFVENAAHQLRNPIAAIASSVAALQAGAADDERERTRFLEHVARESGRIATLVDSLLTLAGLQRGVARPLVELVPLRDLIDDVVASVAVDRAAQIVLDCPERLAVISDREMLAQALGNVVANAAEHSSGTIRIRARLERPDVLVDVADDGPGIPEDLRERIFERFFRGPGSGGHGSGLGLAIAGAATQAAHGRLELLESGDGEGATFRFTIPGAELL
jgi:PAS domain S-box-containing protein